MSTEDEPKRRVETPKIAPKTKKDHEIHIDKGSRTGTRPKEEDN